jgi:hypothetical protein
MVADSGESRHSRAARRLNEPRAAAVVVADGGLPAAVNRAEVTAVREEWRVVDRWWTSEPIRRRYFEVVLVTGRNGVVFFDEERGEWFTQNA